MDTHDHCWCYVDPANQAYKPEVRATRVAQVIKKGVSLPDYLKEDKPGAVGAVQDGLLVDNVMGALRLAGHI